MEKNEDLEIGRKVFEIGARERERQRDAGTKTFLHLIKKAGTFTEH